MPKFRNCSGQELYIVAYGKTVDDDGVFEVSDDDAPGFDCQPSNYVRLDEPKAAKAVKGSE